MRPSADVFGRRASLHLLLVVIVIAGLGTLAAGATLQARQSAQELQEAHAARVSETIADHLAGALASTAELLDGMAAGGAGWRLQEGDPGDLTQLRDLAVRMPGRGLELLDASGRQVASVDPGGSIPAPDAPGRRSMLTTLSESGLGTSDALVRDGVVWIGLAVSAGDGTLVVYDQFSRLGIELYLDRFGAGLGGDYYLTDSRGVVLGASEPAARAGRVPGLPAPSVLATADRPRELAVDGEHLVTIVRPVRGSGWSVVSQQSPEQLYGDTASTTRYAIVALVLLVAVAGLVTARAVARRQRALALNEDRLHGLLKNVNDVVLLIAGRRIVYASPGVEAVLAVAPADAVGRSLEDVLGAGGADLVLDAARAAAEGSSVVARDVAVRTPSGDERWLEAAVADGVGDPALGGLVVTLHDVTERRAGWERVVHAATHDRLTGLANRARFTDVVTAALEESAAAAHGLAVLYIDLDAFKPVNDRLGHHAGDLVLQEVAARLRRVVRETDVAARTGGDEFAVLVAPVDGVAEAEEVARRVLDALGEPCPVLADQGISASVGVVHLPVGVRTDFDTVMRQADLAMYEAKDAGKSTFRTFETRRKIPAAREEAADEVAAPKA